MAPAAALVLALTALPEGSQPGAGTPGTLPPGTTAARDSWFGADKIKHFFVAAFTQTIAYSALQAARVSHDRAIAGAWAVTAAASVGKELYDRRTTGLFSVRDLVWDAAGAGAATVILAGARRRASSADAPVSASMAAVARSATVVPPGRK